jgi:hypothetical protein
MCVFARLDVLIFQQFDLRASERSQSSLSERERTLDNRRVPQAAGASVFGLVRSNWKCPDVKASIQQLFVGIRIGSVSLAPPIWHLNCETEDRC